MKSVIKIPAGYGLHSLKGIGGSVIRQYDLHGDTLQVWSTDSFHLKIRKGESIVEYEVHPSEDSLLRMFPDTKALAKYLSEDSNVSDTELRAIEKK